MAASTIVPCEAIVAGSLELVAGSWQVGAEKLGGDSWELIAGSWQLAVGRRGLEADIEAESC